MKSSRSRTMVVAALGLAIAAGVALGRAVTEARAELDAAKSYREEGRFARATEHYRRSLRWSFPLSPYPAEAVADLEAIARELEKEDDLEGALLAWRSLAGGLAATRFMYSGVDPARERAKDEIARLLAREGGVAMDANLTPERLAADHRRLLDEDASPHPFWGTLLLAGFALWIASLAWLIQRGFDRSGNLVPRAARGPASLALVGLASFVLGLFFA